MTRPGFEIPGSLLFSRRDCFYRYTTEWYSSIITSCCVTSKVVRSRFIFPWSFTGLIQTRKLDYLVNITKLHEIFQMLNNENELRE